VRDAAARLSVFAKTGGTPVVLVGHVTKDGTLAGPKTLEHLVDAVLSFEGERFQAHRVLRALKNRFGPVHELGVFEMTGDGSSR
jgi:Predicted ATP-dependent serine protease